MNAQLALDARYERAKALECVSQASSLREAARACARLLESPPEALASMDVHVLLETCFGVDSARADRWLEAAEIFAAYTVAELPYGKRCGLCAVLRLN